jgi:hypothetical protein
LGDFNSTLRVVVVIYLLAPNFIGGYARSTLAGYKSNTAKFSVDEMVMHI